MRILRTWILHPFLIAAFPVVAFLSQNQDQIKPGSGLRALLACILFAAILLVGYRFALRSWQKSAILTSLSLILFFSYGHIYGLLKETEFSGNLIGRHRILFPVWVILFLLCVGWTTRRWKDDSVGTELLNIFGIIALAFPLIQLASFQIELAVRRSAPAAVVEASSGLQPSDRRVKPDIYYIILDGYTRDDTLAEEFSYDNSSFLKQLESMGFYIAYCSQSN
ncbi:MAG TPA: hypothetical protein VJ768_10325, partial [Anaerolineales bacterium]|nr:hypothetical protein [Anaerolineales bacterium]